MRRCALLLAALVVGSLVLGTWSALSAGRLRDGPHPLYSVATIQQLLARHPAAWVGKSVWVRGVAVPGVTVSCGLPPSTYFDGCLPPHLADAASPATVEALWLADRDQGRLLTLLRRVPILAWFAPAPQALHWGVVATYRVRLRAAPANSCVFLPCYEAVLLDAAP
jgi:hypothetical protein